MPRPGRKCCPESRFRNRRPGERKPPRRRRRTEAVAERGACLVPLLARGCRRGVFRLGRGRGFFAPVSRFLRSVVVGVPGFTSAVGASGVVRDIPACAFELKGGRGNQTYQFSTALLMHLQWFVRELLHGFKNSPAGVA